MESLKSDRTRLAVLTGLAMAFVWIAPAVAGTFVVSNTSESGPGSLRQAILDANDAVGPDTITFAIPGTGVQTISPTNALPQVTEALSIDGTTQPGYAGTPLIELAGSRAGSTANGLLLLSGNCVVRGLAINRYAQSGIRIEGYGTNVIQGNHLGTDATGTLARGNGQYGLIIFNSPGNRVGGTNASEGNLISGNTNSGILISSSSATDNHIEGNKIGVKLDGRSALANLTNGIVINQAPGNWVGGTTAAAGNLISGNGQGGIYLLGTNTYATRVLQNSVGLSITGTNGLPNLKDGVTMDGSPGNFIGLPGVGNFISGNGGSGILVSGVNASSNSVQGNYVGTDVSGVRGVANTNSGILLISARCNQIGGTTAAEGNLFSGNGTNGVFLSDVGAWGNSISGNLIGTDRFGTNALPNAFNGVFITGRSNMIGGLTAGAGNVISGNLQNGVYVYGTNITANQICGNLIGTTRSGLAACANGIHGVYLNFASKNTIGGLVEAARNVIAGNLGSGIRVAADIATGNVVIGNYVGTDITGKAGLPNVDGVWIDNASGNFIGATNSSGRNVISGNSDSGVYIVGSLARTNTVAGNFIGTDCTGLAGLGNNFGVWLSNAPSNIIGGTLAGRNLISGNGTAGVYLAGSLAKTNIVSCNYVGTDVNGQFSIPNWWGIYVAAPNTVVGGTQPGAGNLVSGQNNVGIAATEADCVGAVIQGNWVGLKSDGVSALANGMHNVEIRNGASRNFIGGSAQGAGNRIAFAGSYTGVRVRDGCTNNSIRGNSIFSNAALGIDLSGTGVSANDTLDPDGGANLLQNFPVITLASNRFRTVIAGTLNSLSSQTFTIDFYASPSADSTGYGEGKIWLGSTNVTTDASGNASFNRAFTNSAAISGVVSATATDASGNTSEFSACVAIATGAIADTDGDGMPDDYEIAWGFNPANPADAALDADADGFTNLQEYFAGTSPRDASDKLPFTSQPYFAGNNFWLSFTGRSDRRYSVLRASALGSAWQTLATNLSSLDPTIWVCDTNARQWTTRFYRLRCDP